MSFLKSVHGEQGCYIIHIGSELADSDPEIRQFIARYLNETEACIKKMLKSNSAHLGNPSFYACHLTGLFLTSMSICLVLPKEQKEYHIRNGINIILKKKLHYAQNTEHEL